MTRLQRAIKLEVNVLETVRREEMRRPYYHLRRRMWPDVKDVFECNVEGIKQDLKYGYGGRWETAKHIGRLLLGLFLLPWISLYFMARPRYSLDRYFNARRRELEASTRFPLEGKVTSPIGYDVSGLEDYEEED
jgi:hypothetical protein